MEIGRRIYYDLANGNIIIDVGERSGDIVPTTIDQDIETYIALSERNRIRIWSIRTRFQRI